MFMISSVLFMSCDDDTENLLSTLTLSFSGLSDLGSSEVYEGWIIVDGSPVSTGIFTVDGNGDLSKSNFNVATDDLEAATMFVLSIEPANDTDPAPSDLKVLSGAFSGSSASLDLGIIADFSGIAGKYILATPTSMDDTDENSGIWFLDLATGSPTLGLTLPDLSSNDNWIYEGWAVFPGASGPISTGTFENANGFDSNMAGPYKGMNGDGPAFPGDDFVTGSNSGVTFPSDLAGGMVVISVEPQIDNSPAPFLVKPLVGQVGAGATDHVTYTMGTNLITGMATR